MYNTQVNFLHTWQRNTSETESFNKSQWCRPFDSFCLYVKLNANRLIAATVTDYFVSWLCPISREPLSIQVAQDSKFLKFKTKQ